MNGAKELPVSNYQEEVYVGPLSDYEPSDSEALREYEIRIQFLNRGCIVNIGCKSIAFESAQSAMNEINEYVNSPREVQKKWRAMLG